MRNNKGFGRFEVMTMIVVLLLIFAGAGYSILNGASGQRLSTFKDNALKFSQTVVTNGASFRNTKVVYLDEAIDGKFSNKIKNPLGSGYCDPTESRVNLIDGQSYATLRCGDYLIDQALFKGTDPVPVYKVSEWSETKPKGDNVEEKVLYNCVDNGKELFDTYYEDYYLVYKVFKQFNQEYYTIKSISKSVCTVTEKTFYRTKELVEEKKK